MPRMYIYVLKYEPQIHVPRMYIYVHKEAIFYIFRLLALFDHGCLEESGKEQKVRWQEKLHCGHNILYKLCWHLWQIQHGVIVKLNQCQSRKLLWKCFAVRDSNLGEKSLIDSEEDISKYCGNSSESEDEVESTKESWGSDESDIDVSEDAAANTGDGNGRGHGLHSTTSLICN